ncbi:cyclic nucleotide-binding domain-containing protein [Candidatus Riflebacteria bacterium]
MAENFLADYSEEEREKILAIGKSMSYPKESTVYREGEPGFGFFIILKGEVSLNKREDGEDVTYDYLERGEFFGEIDLAEQTRRRTNAICESECEFLLITRSKFDVLVKINPITSLKIMRAMGEKLRRPLTKKGTKVKKEEKKTHDKCKILTFFSPANNVGQTSIAINVAGGLAGMLKKKVCLIDLDLQFGDIQFILFPDKKILNRSIAELAQEDEWTTQIVQGHLEKHEVSGMDILPAPLEPEKSELVDVPAIKKILTVLRENYDYVIVDTHSLLNDLNMTLFEEANSIFFIITPYRIQIKNLNSSINLLQQIYSEKFFDKLNIIINREPKGFVQTKLDLDLPKRPKFHLPYSQSFYMTSIDGTVLALEKGSDAGINAMKSMICDIAGADPKLYLKKSLFQKISSVFGDF